MSVVSAIRNLSLGTFDLCLCPGIRIESIYLSIYISTYIAPLQFIKRTGKVLESVGSSFSLTTMCHNKDRQRLPPLSTRLGIGAVRVEKA